MPVVVLALTFGLAAAGRSERLSVEAIEGIPFERVALEQEWRMARPIAAGRHLIEIGPLAHGDLLRFAALPRPESKTGVALRLKIGDREIFGVHHKDLGAWIQRAVHVTEESMIGKPATLEVDSDHGFWMAPFELRHAQVGPPNVLIFLIDTLRQDRLGVYGHRSPTSPHIDRFARDAVRFNQVIPQASWTRPSIASLMTSTYPKVHGALKRSDVMRPLRTLAGALTAQGYESHGFFSNPNLLPLYGFGREYSRYVDCDSSAWKDEGANDQGVIDEVHNSLAMTQGRPWFFYVHTMGAHWPYTAPPDIVNALAKGRKVTKSLSYDAEVVVVDQQFGRLIKRLKTMGLYEQALIIVTSDHGQELMERGRHQHGNSLHREQLRVPFLLKLPGNRHAGEVRNHLLEMVDVAPTVLETLGLTPEDAFQGRSFAALLDERGAGKNHPRRTAYASTFLEGRDQQTVQHGNVKYIQDRQTGQTEWYDVSRDPWEKEPLRRAPKGGLDLATLAVSRATKSVSGPHLFIQGSLAPKQRLTGTIVGVDVEGHSLTTQWRPHTSSHHGDTVSFAIGGDGDGQGGAAVGHADLRIEISGDGPLVVSLAIDGEPLPAQRVAIGAENLPSELRDTRFDLKMIEGIPTTLHFGRRKGPITAFLWHLPSTAKVEDEDLPPDVLKALEALGYVE